MTYLLDTHCTFVKVVKLFLTVRRLARTWAKQNKEDEKKERKKEKNNWQMQG